MRDALTLALVAAASLACGSTVVIDGTGAAGEGAADGTAASGAGASASGGFASHAPCMSADGVRVCGGDEDCPELAPPECPGFGCTSALDRDDFEPSVAGVCWADVDGAAGLQCHACRDGEACVQRYPDQLVCVSVTVCEALWDLGARDVCRWADKSRYDHQPLPPAPSTPCPEGEHGFMCGGSCGDCQDDERCTGRSPSHPYGICAFHAKAGPNPEVQVPRCIMNEQGDVIESCSQPSSSPLCAVFETAPEDASAAHRYGVCLFDVVCLHLAEVLPGGLRCYDVHGNQVAP